MSEKIQEPNSLDSVDQGQLADWIDEYEKRFGPFARLGRAGAFLATEEQEERLMREDAAPEEKEVQLARAAQSDIVRRNQPIAQQVGLSLDFPAGEEEGEWAPEMRLDVGSGEKFTKCLQALQKLSVSQARGLVKVAEILAKQLTHGYDLSNVEDERLLELASSLKSITEEYGRLTEVNPTLQASATLLEDVRRSVNGRYLREYILAKDGQLLDPPEARTFGPGRWHTFMLIPLPVDIFLCKTSYAENAFLLSKNLESE